MLLLLLLLLLPYSLTYWPFICLIIHFRSPFFVMTKLSKIVYNKITKLEIVLRNIKRA